MNYIIQTPSATRLKDEILDCVSAKANARSNSARLLPARLCRLFERQRVLRKGRKNGIGIATWQTVETDEGI